MTAWVLQLLRQRCPTSAVFAAVAGLAASLIVVISKSHFASFSGQADAYCVGEWLINYGGGFVRRGLGGTVILWVSQMTGLRPRLVLFAVLAGSYAAIFLALGVALLRSKEVAILDLILVLSPLAALYPVVHHVAGQRKEVLMLALVSIAYLTDIGALRSVARYVLWSGALAVLVAINDGVVFFLPILILYLRVLTPSAYPTGFRVFALALPALAIFLVGYLLSSRVDIQAICATDARYESGLWCAPSSPGQFPVAVSWLKASGWDGLHSVIARYSVLTGSLTILLGMLGLLPVLVALEREAVMIRCAVRAMPAPRLYVAACIGAFAALLLIASDWSRWFYILTCLLTLVYFAARDRRSAGVLPRGDPAPSH